MKGKSAWPSSAGATDENMYSRAGHTLAHSCLQTGHITCRSKSCRIISCEHLTTFLYYVAFLSRRDRDKKLGEKKKKKKGGEGRGNREGEMERKKNEKNEGKERR